MAATIIDGPMLVYGNLSNIEAGVLSPEAVPDPNQDNGPNLSFQGEGVLDPRLIFLKDKMLGFTGTAQAFLSMPYLESVRQIPMAFGTTKIAAAAAPSNGVPVTLAASSAGVTAGVPVRQFSPILNSGTVVTAMALDFGFAYGNVTAGNATIPVGNGYDFFVGMPLVIPGTGPGGTALLTFTTAVNQQGNTITVANAPSTTLNPAPIGTGDLWGPNEVPAGFPTPQAAYPFLANGPGLFLDSRQSLARGISITAAAGVAGNFLVSGMDIYGQPMTELVAAPVGAATTFSKKAFKYIVSITPQFSNAATYSVGTSDVYGFGFRSTLFEDMDICWNGAWVTASTTGYTPAVLTQPSANNLGDVRGTAQFGAAGTGGPAGNTPLNVTPSSGVITSLLPVGVRLEVAQRISVSQDLQAEQLTPFYLTGVTQA